MKQFEKFLQASKKLEDRQTTRRAKEVAEIEKFDSQKEHHQCRKLERIHNIGRAHIKRQKQELEEPIIFEQEWSEDKARKLSEIEEFERQAQDMQINIPGNEFEIIEEIQRGAFGEKPHELKQLSAGSPDVLRHDLTDDLTESHLQRELKQNETAINEGQDSGEEEEKTRSIFFFLPPVSRRQ